MTRQWLQLILQLLSAVVVLSNAVLERLGRQLLAEIGLEQPHIPLTYLRGFVRIDRGKREIAAPWPTSTREALYVLAHELGHWHLHTERVRLGRWGFREDITDYAMEYESERYAQVRLRELGVPVPRWMTREGKEIVGERIRKALRVSMHSHDEDIAHWAGVDIDVERSLEWAAITWRMLKPARTRCGFSDILVGHLDRAPRKDARVEIVATSDRGASWTAGKPYLIPHPGDAGKRTHLVSVLDMLSLVTEASRARLKLNRT